MARIVMKFGGTSVADLDRIRNVAARVKREVEAGHEVAVVVSAMAGVTNQLVSWCQELSPLHDAREYDTVVATGEQVTSGLLAIALQASGVEARSWQGWQVPIRTDGAHGKARVEAIDGDELVAADAAPARCRWSPASRASGRWQPRDHAWAAAGPTCRRWRWRRRCKADRCDIYTDVDGVYTTDPRIVPRARKLERISYEEMLELASVGAKVLQTRSVELAMKERVRVQVLSSFEDKPGSLVVDEDEIVEQPLVSGIAYSRDDAKVTLRRVPDRPGIAASVFGALSTANVNVDMIVQNVGADGTTDMTFTVGKADLARAQDVLDRVRDGARLRGAARRPGGGEDQRGRHRHAQPRRRREHHVPGAGGEGHQHPGHLHQRDQGERAGGRGIHGAGGAGAAHRLRPGRAGGMTAPPPRWTRFRCGTRRRHRPAHGPRSTG